MWWLATVGLQRQVGLGNVESDVTGDQSVRDRTVGLILLAVLAALDLVLIFLAIRPDPRAAAAVANDKPVTVTPTPGRPSASPSAGAADSQQISLSLGDGPTALMAIPGSCKGGGGKTMLSNDNGANWKPLEGPAAIVPRVDVTGAGAGFAIGAPEGCAAPQLFRGTDDLAGWGEGIAAADT